MMKLLRVLAAAVMIALPATICHSETKAAPGTSKAGAKQAVPAAKVDLNSASRAELEKLPGIGPAAAGKIIAGRPYASTGDLARAGIPAKTITKITPLVTVGAVPAAAKPAKPKTSTPSGQAVPAAKVDLNSATRAELEKLPGIGPASAGKIIAGRPYAATGDLARAGIPAKTITKIAPLVTVGAVPAAVKPAAPKASVPSTPIRASKPPQTAAPTSPPKPPQASAPTGTVRPQMQPPAGKDMVWVNTESKIYHKQGSQWYGKTREGSYMTESEAIKAGYRAAKTGAR